MPPRPRGRSPPSWASEPFFLAFFPTFSDNLSTTHSHGQPGTDRSSSFGAPAGLVILRTHHHHGMQTCDGGLLELAAAAARALLSGTRGPGPAGPVSSILLKLWLTISLPFSRPARVASGQRRRAASASNAENREPRPSPAPLRAIICTETEVESGIFYVETNDTPLIAK